MAEHIADLGYMAVIEQAAVGTPLTPDTFIPLVNEDLTTNVNLDDKLAIIGNRAARQGVVQGQRDHQGSIEALAEPNSLVYLLSMLLKRGSQSGGSTVPFTHPFTVDEPVMPYTVDFLKGNIVHRYWDVKAANMQPSFNDNKMHISMDVSALGSFIVRELVSATGTAPTTITLDTNYDPNPTKGLVVGDTIQVYNPADGTTIDAVVDAIPTATTIETSEDLSTADDGWLLYITGQTPSSSWLEPFKWSHTEFRFADTAANALSATHTPMEQGSDWSIDFGFNADEGEKRSGSLDPASLVKKLVDAEVNVKNYWDTPEDMNRFLTVQSRALVIRHFSQIYGSAGTTQTELRITLNTVNWRENPTQLQQDEIIYSEGVLIPSYNASDGQVLDVKLLNGVDLS